MQSLDEYCRASCGFAAVKDIRTMEMLDEQESFVLAETFKYLYMIFAEPSDLLIDVDNYVLTTEAHFLPLSIAAQPSADAVSLSDGNESAHCLKALVEPSNVVFLVCSCHVASSSIRTK